MKSHLYSDYTTYLYIMYSKANLIRIFSTRHFQPKCILTSQLSVHCKSCMFPLMTVRKLIEKRCTNSPFPTVIKSFEMKNVFRVESESALFHLSEWRLASATPSAYQIWLLQSLPWQLSQWPESDWLTLWNSRKQTLKTFQFWAVGKMNVQITF